MHGGITAVPYRLIIDQAETLLDSYVEINDHNFTLG